MKQILTLTIILTLSVLNIFAQKENPYIRRGNRAFEAKNYPTAESRYQHAKNINKNSLIATYNIANAQNRQKNYQGAIENLQSIAERSKSTDTLNNIFYNIANNYTKIAEDSLKAQKMNGAIDNLQNAVNYYKSAIKQNPNDFQAKYNYLLTKQILDELKKQQQQNQKNQQNQQNKDQKNQQNKDKKDQDKQQQNQNSQDKDKQNKPKEQKQAQIPYDEMIRMLNAVQNQDQQTQVKVKQNMQKNVKTKDKNW